MKPTRTTVLKRIDEYGRINRAAFLKKYANNRPSRWRRIDFKGILYDMKAIWAAAHRPPVRPASFNTSEPWVELPKLGFDLVDERDFDENARFEYDVTHSLADSSQQRQQRLKSARKKPKRIRRIIVDFVRNPDVVAEALFQAKGVCGACKNKAPFRRKIDDTPYLEVHHKIPLSEGGDDALENAIALCPNCHRKAHFGEPNNEA